MNEICLLKIKWLKYIIIKSEISKKDVIKGKSSCNLKFKIILCDCNFKWNEMSHNLFFII